MYKKYMKNRLRMTAVILAEAMYTCNNTSLTHRRLLVLIPN